MKVVLVNGSPNTMGCTYTALREVADTLGSYDIRTEIFQLGKNPVHGCIACGRCHDLRKCIFDDDPANALLEKIIEADGLVVGTPVYFANANGALLAVLDRCFFAGKDRFHLKPAAAVASCRRAGGINAINRINQYFSISHMPTPTSQYWNEVHGITPDEVRQDKEGMQTMRTLGHNMAWLLKSIHAGNVPPPEGETPVYTNFIR